MVLRDAAAGSVGLPDGFEPRKVAAITRCFFGLDDIVCVMSGVRAVRRCGGLRRNVME